MSDAHLRSQPTYMTLRRAAEVRKATRFSPNAHAQSRTLPSPLTGRARAVRLRLRMRLPAGLVTLGLLVLLASTTSCRQPLTLSPRHVSPDTLLIFEQRVASSALESGPDWESWRLYESGRLVYSRAGGGSADAASAGQGSARHCHGTRLAARPRLRAAAQYAEGPQPGRARRLSHVPAVAEHWARCWHHRPDRRYYATRQSSGAAFQCLGVAPCSRSLSRRAS